MNQRKSDESMVRLSREHIRMAKSIASFHGMSLKEYFGRKVDADMKVLPKEMSLRQEFPEKKKKGGLYFDSPFR